MQKVSIIKKGNVKVPSFAEKMAKMEKEAAAKEAKRAKTAAKKQKELAALKESAEQKDSGIRIYMNQKGDGEVPVMGQTAKINYAGYLENGQLFDSNIIAVAEQYDVVDEKRKAANLYIPLTTVYSTEARVIPGFREALLSMRVGDKLTVFIPSHLAYGERGAGALIPPNSDLVFEMELVGVE